MWVHIMIYTLKRRNCVWQTRNFVLKLRNSAWMCIQNEEFCIKDDELFSCKMGTLRSSLSSTKAPRRDFNFKSPTQTYCISISRDVLRGFMLQYKCHFLLQITLFRDNFYIIYVHLNGKFKSNGILHAWSQTDRGDRGWAVKSAGCE